MEVHSSDYCKHSDCDSNHSRSDLVHGLLSDKKKTPRHDISVHVRGVKYLITTKLLYEYLLYVLAIPTDDIDTTLKCRNLLAIKGEDFKTFLVNVLEEYVINASCG